MARAGTLPNFQQSFRRSQGRFRDTSSTVSDTARYPDDDKGKRNSHLLTLGYEAENLIPSLRGDEGATDFLARRDIKWWKSSRSGDDCSRNMPTRNLASSQVSC